MIKAAYSDKNLVVDILTDSFETNRSVNYIVKQDKKRVNRIRSLMDYSFEVCYSFGEVFLSDDKKACALIQHNHNVKFLFHDSRILSEIDSRQQATLFKVAYDNCLNNDFQYIISLNQNTFDSLKNEMEVDVFEDIIAENIILELTDEANEAKLLGMEIELDYDKE